MKKRFWGKGVKIILVVICLAVAAAACIFVVQSRKQQEIRQHLELAKKYLSELNYEQAIVEYTIVLKLDAKNQDITGTLADIYRDYADSFTAENEYEQAIRIVKEGIEATGSAELLKYLEELEKQRELWEQKQEEAKRRQDWIQLKLEELYRLMDSGEQEATIVFLQELFDKSDTSEGSVMWLTEQAYNPAGDAENGKVLEVGKVLADQIYYYFGDMVAGIREGIGSLVIFCPESEFDNTICKKYYSVYDGEWQGDYPNGEGKYYKVFRTEYYQGDHYLGTPLSVEIWEGNFINGYLDGHVKIICYEDILNEAEKIEAERLEYYMDFKLGEASALETSGTIYRKDGTQGACMIPGPRKGYFVRDAQGDPLFQQ